MTTHSEQTAIEMLYRDANLDGFSWQGVEKYHEWSEHLGLPAIDTLERWGTHYLIPEPWASVDVEHYVADLCPHDDVAQERVALELAEYHARNMYDVLRLMIYIIHTLKTNNIVWGVGRGSSVSSYVLYLIGVHRIDSIRYNLDINEFLR